MLCFPGCVVVSVAPLSQVSVQQPSKLPARLRSHFPASVVLSQGALLSPRGALVGGEQWFFGCHCLFKGTVRSHFPTEHGLGWRCSVFITQFLVLHDVKNFFFRTI